MNWLLSRGRVGGLLLAFCAVGAGWTVLGQEKSGSPKSAKSTSSATPALQKKERAKPRGRLPAYFSRVVSETQREEIYKIQREYRVQIEKLKTDLEKLETDMNMEVFAVLSEEQRMRVTELQEEARRKRESRRKTTKSGTS